MIYFSTGIRVRRPDEVGTTELLEGIQEIINELCERGYEFQGNIQKVMEQSTKTVEVDYKSFG